MTDIVSAIFCFTAYLLLNCAVLGERFFARMPHGLLHETDVFARGRDIRKQPILEAGESPRPEDLFGMFEFFFFLVSLSVFFLLFMPKARGETPEPVLDAALLALPMPVMVVGAESMRLYTANEACGKLLGKSCVPGVRFGQLFVADNRMEHFLRTASGKVLPSHIDPGAQFRQGVREEVSCHWKDSLGRPLPMVITLFFIEKTPRNEPFLYLSADPNGSISSASLRRGFDSFPEMLFFKDRNGRFMLCNSSFCSISERSLDEVLGKTVPELGLAQPFDRLLCAHDDNVLESGLSFFSEMTVSTEDGASISFENHSYPDIAADGSIQGIFGMCRDITLSKVTAEALKRQGDLLQAANDAALLLFSDDEELDDLAARVLGSIGTLTGADRVDVWRNHGSSVEGLLCTQVYSWKRDNSPNYTGVYANTVIYSAHLPGWEEELSSGRCVNTLNRELSPQELRQLAMQRTGAALAAPILFRSTFWGFISMGVREKEHDWGRAEEATLRSVGLLLAATMQRREIQEALAESEQRFRDVTMAAGEIVWELDAQGYFSYISERVFALTGYRPEEVRGMRWEDFAIDVQGEEMTGRMFQASVPTGSFRAFEHKIRGKFGEAIWLFTSGKLLTGPDGIAGLRGTSLDISHDKQTTENLNTTLKALENANKELELSAQRAHALARKAESASRAKSEFLANMSHEIRTPLNAITGLAYLMKKTRLSGKQDDYVNKIHGAGITLLGVVNDILDFSKIESGKFELEYLPFVLSSVFDNLASITGPKAEEQGLDAAFFIESDVPMRLVGDQLRLGQVLINIVGNAVKFTEKGGISVSCQLEQDGDETILLRFVVRDTGIGIPEERQHLLFQSFSQVDSSITRRYGGTGLGLVITKKLVELAGGSMSLESSPHWGTVVTVTMPLGVDRDSAGRVCLPQNGRLRGVRVILIEPSEMQRAFLSLMLEDMGCEAAVFSGIDELFKAAGRTGCLADARVIIMPLALMQHEQSGNMKLLKEACTGVAPPVLAVVPFGYVDGLDDRGGLDGRIKPSALISRPLLSYDLYDVLCRLVHKPDTEGMNEERHKVSVAKVPYFPDTRILLVEDNLINQQIAGELLLEAGVKVTVAENGRVAIDLLESAQEIAYDLVFMDLQMPEMDGITATRHLRGNPRFDSLPIIAMTAHATVEERQRCLDIGMNEHIAKPIDVAALYDTLRRWLANSGRQEKGKPDRLPGESGSAVQGEPSGAERNDDKAPVLYPVAGERSSSSAEPGADEGL